MPFDVLSVIHTAVFLVLSWKNPRKVIEYTPHLVSNSAYSVEVFKYFEYLFEYLNNI